MVLIFGIDRLGGYFYGARFRAVEPHVNRVCTRRKDSDVCVCVEKVPTGKVTARESGVTRRKESDVHVSKRCQLEN